MFDEEYVQIFNVSQSLVFFLPSEGILKVEGTSKDPYLPAVIGLKNNCDFHCLSLPCPARITIEAFTSAEDDRLKAIKKSVLKTHINQGIYGKKHKFISPSLSH